MPAGLPRQSAWKIYERKGRDGRGEERWPVVWKTHALTIVLSEMTEEMCPPHIQKNRRPRKATHTLLTGSQNTGKVPSAAISTFIQLSLFCSSVRTVSVHPAAYDQSQLHQLGVYVWGCWLTLFVGYAGLFFFLLLSRPKTMVFLACERFPPLHSSVQELHCEWSKFQTKRSKFDSLMFLCGVLFILFVHVLFLVGGAFSSPRLALLSCDLVYRGWGGGGAKPWE